MLDTAFEHGLALEKRQYEVRRWYVPNRVALTRQATLKQVCQYFKEQQRNEAIVCENGKLVGKVSLIDVMTVLMKGANLNDTVEGILNPSVEALKLDDSIINAVGMPTSHIPVVDSDLLFVGILSQAKIVEELFTSMSKLHTLENVVAWFDICFDTAYEGICVVDPDGVIRMFNQAYSRHVGMSKEEAIGRHCTEVIENTRLPVVLQTGVPERNQLHRLQGKDMVVHRIPIWRENQIIGAVGVLVLQGISELFHIVERAQELYQQQSEKPIAFRTTDKTNRQITTLDQIIGKSDGITKSKKIAWRAAKTSATVLITGESGVGKEIFAKAIHYLSPYRNGPMIAVNCAAIPENLVESELFGYEEGAFTGSKRDGKPGKFELAHGGTLFLDEIADMSLHMQAKILRVLQEREVERIGGTKSIEVDFRLIAATNRSIEDMVREGTFREDLYYRINVIPLHIPPLRERKEDIPLFLSHYLEKICQSYQCEKKEIDKEALLAMIRYEWPGNVRQLVNVVERLVTLVDGNRISVEDVSNYFLTMPKQSSVQTKANRLDIVKETGSHQEREMIIQALKEENGNKTRAAKKLGISRGTLYNRLSKYNLL